MTTRAAIYTRISQDRSGEGLGVERQEEACRKYAADHGFDVVRHFSDNSTSAYSGRSRPDYSEMLAAITSGDIDAVVVWRMDRLHRLPIELEEYAAVCTTRKGGKAVYTYAVSDGGEINLASADGLLRAGIMGQVARFESATKAERARAKAAQKAAAGEWTGGIRPFGWTVEDKLTVLHPEEAAALTAAHHDILAAHSLGTIARRWNDPDRQGGALPTVTGKRWTATQVRQVLLRPRNAGLYVFHGDVLNRDTIPAVVSEDIWRAVVTLLSDPGRRKGDTNKATHLLGGIAQCHCGRPVSTGRAYARADKATGERKMHKVYRCQGHGPGHVAKRLGYVDAVVELAILRLLAEELQAEPTSPSVQAEAGRLRLELDALQVREEEGATLLADGDLDAASWPRFIERIRTQRAALESALADLGLDRPADDPLHRALRDSGDLLDRFTAWQALSIDERRDFVRSHFHVVLHRHTTGTSRVFDPDTVSVHRKSRAEARRVFTGEELATLERTGKGESWEAVRMVRMLSRDFDQKGRNRIVYIELPRLVPELISAEAKEIARQRSRDVDRAIFGPQRAGTI
ncbi:hypothetical protein CIK75_02540 [Glutamicibacter sp. BW78]|uniref:recombinase family protein n=1 Tax=Glutamicibacter sp. BW78 TaxID=2024403 RepID=UPI000BB9BA13|nr:recombinase family protein [Glutamicibacter sp. BW78]PCC26520.1 hypothetical protein CIK75_02540 [Glutamicibacter sp. BW78]